MIDGVKIAIDSWITDADLCYISHAHMDHIPNLPKRAQKRMKEGKSSTQFLCSKITKEIAEARTYRNFTFNEENWLLGQDLKKEDSIKYKDLSLTLIPNGHTYGSMSLLIEGTEKILYTSDFITEDRIFPGSKTNLTALKPIKCDRLIAECTFGAPKFIFPSFHETVKKLNDYIQSQINDGTPIILLGYAFGKSQVILNTLSQMNRIILQKDIAKNTAILEKNGINFNPWEPYGNYNMNRLIKLRDYILIIPPYFMFLEPYKNLIKTGAKVILLSGKVLNELYRKEFNADKYLPFSDHCDLNSLIRFFENCDFKYIYLEHGKIEIIIYILLQKKLNSFWI
jgi:putative mRNA 3-end processing factor